MIADQLATLVVDAAAVIRLVRPDGEGVMTGGRARATDALSAEQKRVHDALPARGAVTIGEIAFSAGLELPAVRTALARLEVTGLIDGDGARWWLV